MARHGRGTDEADVPPAKISSESLKEAAHLFGYLKPYRLKFMAALICLVCSNMLGLVFPLVTGRLVDGALKEKAGVIVEKAPIASGLIDDIDRVALLLMLVLAGQAGLSFLELVWINEVGERSVADLRRDTYGRLVRLPMAFHARRRVGELSSRVAADVSQIQATVINVIPQFLRQLVMLIGGIVLITMTSLRLTLIMMSSFPILIGIAVVFGRLMRKTSRDSQDRLAESGVVVEETLQGIASVKAFGNEQFETDRYGKSLAGFLVAVIRGARFRGAFVSFIIFALFGAVVLVLWYGAHMVQAGTMTAGDLTSFMLLTLFVAGAMGSFADLYSQLQRTLGASQRVRDILREPIEVISVPGKALPITRLRGEVIFDQVRFRYPTRSEVEVLRGVTLQADPGKRIALVGPSGAGKSTLVSLLLRFYDPESGQVKIDGHDARDYDLHDLRAQTAIVPQDVLLFGGTIGENIAYGRTGASLEEVIDAAKKANAHDFITALPEGYQTRVGDRGLQISGGQRQRVAIARAILRDPAILILDEATSSLDSESENLVMQALDRLMQGRTSLVIAHRLSTVRRADRIYVLKEGMTVESGTHEELIQREDGVYRNLTELQLEQ